RVPGWTPPPGRGWQVAEVEACPSRHHRPRASRADQVPRAKVVQPVGCSTLARGACPLPGGRADGDGMTLPVSTSCRKFLIGVLLEGCGGAVLGRIVGDAVDPA